MCSGTGQLVSFVLKNRANDAIPFLAAIAVTAMARLYSRCVKNQRPLVYIITGLLVLVPGSVGVKGMSDIWGGDSQSGLEFTFKMLLIGVCLSIGVFVSLIPRKNWLIQSSVKKKTDSVANESQQALLLHREGSSGDFNIKI